jgi:hypothetical protein
VGGGNYARFWKDLSPAGMPVLSDSAGVGGLTGLAGAAGVEGLWRCGGEQVSRFAFGFAPASGRLGASATRLFIGPAEAVPFRGGALDWEWSLV